MTEFNAKEQTEKVVEWIKDWFAKNGRTSKAVIGISGGKDSSVVAALCVKALKKERVVGVLMPNGVQHDIDYSYDLVNYLDISHVTCNIQDAVKAITKSVIPHMATTKQAEINLPARVRMTTLYMVSQSLGGRVANTCNLSEDYVGYATKYGDAAGDFAPLKSFTTEEVIAIGRELGLPEKFLIKPPSDGLCGKTDEDNLGFTYEILNRYIRTGEIDDPETKEKIDHLHVINEFKEKVIDRYVYEP